MGKMRRFSLFLCLFALSLLFLVKFANSQSVGAGLKIVGFDSDHDGIPDDIDPDDDNDGIPDINDTLTGNSSSVQSVTITVNITINNSINFTKHFNETLEVLIKDINVILVNFSFNFSDKPLNLANITVERKIIAEKGTVLLRGVTLTPGQTKTLFVDNINTSINTLCIKDAHIDSISEISKDCSGASETMIVCPGNSSNYTCTNVSDNTRFKLEGANFTGIEQQPDVRGPTVALVLPVNNSGRKIGNFTFVYTANDVNSVDNCSLIINNKINATNTSITKGPQINFKRDNLSAGSYNWSVNCTDSLGNIGDSNQRAFSVLFLTGFGGNTTDLASVDDIRNVSNFVVEKSSFGKINFSRNLDLSKGFDLDKYIKISSNRIELNSTALTEMNVSATLEIEGLAFSDPRILIDGNLCPNDICKKVSYSGGVLKFNVTHWTSYSSEETPADAASSASSGGGGGASGGGGGGGPPNVPVVTDFTIDKASLKVVLKQGQTKTETLSIKNIGTTIFDVRAILSDLERFKIGPEGDEITTTLSPNEEKSISIIFKALENEKPDVYPKKILLKSPSKEQEVVTIFEVDSAEPLFDVDVEVLPDSKKIFPGKELSLEVNLFNVRGFGRVDVVVEYSIKDSQGNLLATEHETLAVETQAKFARSLLVPSDLKPGTYVAFVKVIYGDSVGVSSDLFEVAAKSIRLYPIQLNDYRNILLIAAAALIICILIFSGYRFGYLKKKAPKTKVEEVKQLKGEEKTKKLKKELEALESAYKSGFISEESYQRDRKRVEDKIKNLK